MYYGEYYRWMGSPDLVIFWYDPSDGQVYHYEDLMSEFGYQSQDEILWSGAFVPLFKTDIVELERQFIAGYKSKKLSKHFDSLSDDECHSEFSRLIHYEYISPWTWGKFEREHLYHDALEWCRENHIKFEDNYLD